MPKFYDFKVFTKHDLKLCILCQTLSHFKIFKQKLQKKVAKMSKNQDLGVGTQLYGYTTQWKMLPNQNKPKFVIKHIQRTH